MSVNSNQIAPFRFQSDEQVDEITLDHSCNTDEKVKDFIRSLPHLLEEILPKVGIKDLGSLSATCRYFNSYPKLWQLVAQAIMPALPKEIKISPSKDAVLNFYSWNIDMTESFLFELFDLFDEQDQYETRPFLPCAYMPAMGGSGVFFQKGDLRRPTYVYTPPKDRRPASVAPSSLPRERCLGYKLRRAFEIMQIASFDKSYPVETIEFLKSVAPQINKRKNNRDPSYPKMPKDLMLKTTNYLIEKIEKNLKDLKVSS